MAGWGGTLMSSIRLTKIGRRMLGRLPAKVDVGPFPELDDAAHHAADTVFIHGLSLPQVVQELLVERIGDLVVNAVDEAAAIVGQPEALWINEAKRQALQFYFARLRALASSNGGGRA